MITYDRPVRFEDTDAAGLVFFGKFFGYAHEAMEALFSGLDDLPESVPRGSRGLIGGYAHLITDRKIGFPAVHVDADFKSPLRYGDTARISVDVTKIGNKSATLRFTFARVANGAHVATISHTCAVSDLTELHAIPIPDDVRAVLQAHLVETP